MDLIFHEWGSDLTQCPFWDLLILSPAGDEDEDESGEERLPSCFDYVMHFLTVFWKVLFACVPPTEYCHGWACFIVSILIIGMLTAIIGDLASHFGCTIGLKDSVTAVVFVAFGTSVPGEREGLESAKGKDLVHVIPVLCLLWHLRSEHNRASVPTMHKSQSKGWMVTLIRRSNISGALLMWQALCMLKNLHPCHAHHDLFK